MKADAAPLADAILAFADEQGVEYGDPVAFDSVTGKGVQATVGGNDVLVDKPNWLSAEGIDLSNGRDDIERLQSRGLTVAGVVRDGDLLGGVMAAYEIGKESYRKTHQNLVTAFAFNGVDIAAATTGVVHSMFAMVLSVSVVLANSFAGQLLSGEGVNTEFALGERTDGDVRDGRVAADLVSTS